MPFSGTGIFNRIHNWVSDAAAAINITDTRMDAEMDGFANGLTNCVTKDGQTNPVANLPMNGFRHTGVGNSSSPSSYPSTSQVQNSSFNYAVDTGVVNAYVVSLSPAPTAYVDGMDVFMRPANTNTASSTINVNSLGIREIFINSGDTVAAGGITAGGITHLKYNGTNFRIVGEGNVGYKNKANTWISPQSLNGASVNFSQGANVASASSCNIWVQDGNSKHVTGNVTINNFAAAGQQGMVMFLIFDGTPTLVHSASLNLQAGASNITAAVGDSCFVYALTTTVALVFGYSRENGSALSLAPNSVGTTNLQNSAVTQVKLGFGSVGQSEIKNGGAIVSTTSPTLVNIILPGGSYGFLPTFRVSSGSGFWGGDGLVSAAFAANTISTVDVTTIAICHPSSATIFATQLFVGASPPYNLGDGDIPLFIFAELEPSGKIISAYSATDAPWHYNGPTNIAADSYVNGVPYQEKKQFMVEHGSLKKAIAKGIKIDKAIEDLAISPMVNVEITQSVKNADMGLIPHPFASKKPGNTVVLIDPVSSMCEKLAMLQKSGESVLELLHDGNLIIGNKVNRSGPPGVDSFSIKWKLTN